MNRMNRSAMWPNDLVTFAQTNADSYGERVPQCFFNTLARIQPEVAEKLRGSLLDPFHKELVTQAVIDFCWEHWNLDHMSDTVTD